MTPLRLRDPDELDPVRSRYVKMMIHAATTGRPPRPSPMDAGLALCDVLAGREVREDALEPGDVLGVHGPGGNAPPFYRGLLIHCVATARGLAQHDATAHATSLRKMLAYANNHWAEPYAPEASMIAPAFEAPDAHWYCHVAWLLLSDTSVTRLATRKPGKHIVQALKRFCERQVSSGTYLENHRGVNPETWWYHELVLLHALTSFAILNNDAETLASARRAARFHHAETQPDHATSQPWAIHAFLMEDETFPTADLMLLAANVNQPGGLDAVSRILLADAAVCMLAAS